MPTNFLSGIVAGGDSATAAQYNNARKDILQNAGDYANAGGTGDVITLSIDAQIAVYSAGQIFKFKAGAANTGAATLNVNAIGAKTIKKFNDQDLEANDIENGQIVSVIYDGTNLQLLSPVATSLSSANKLILTNGSNAGALHKHNNASFLVSKFTANIETHSTATEQTLFAFTLNAGLLGIGNVLRLKIYILDWGCDGGSGHNQTLKLKYGGTTIATISLAPGIAISDLEGYIDAIIMGSGATNTQEGNLIFTALKSGIMSSSNPITGWKVETGTAAEDSTTNLTVAITIQNSSSAVGTGLVAINGFASLDCIQ